MKKSIGDLVAETMRASLNDEGYMSLFKKASKKDDSSCGDSMYADDAPTFEDESFEDQLSDEERLELAKEDMQEATKLLSNEHVEMGDSSNQTLHDEAINDLILASEALDEMGLGTASRLILKVASKVKEKKKEDSKKGKKKNPFKNNFFNRFKKKDDAKKKVSNASESLLDKDIGEGTFSDLEDEEREGILRQKGRKGKTDEFLPSSFMGENPDEQIEVTDDIPFYPEEDSESAGVDTEAHGIEGEELGEDESLDPTKGLDLSSHESNIIKYLAGKGVKATPSEIRDPKKLERLFDRAIKNEDARIKSVEQAALALKPVSPGEAPKAKLDLSRLNRMTKKK